MKIFSIILLAIMTVLTVPVKAQPEVEIQTVRHVNENRRPFNWYAPYAYEYYYQDQSGSDGCKWQYTTQGLVYTCD